MGGVEYPFHSSLISTFLQVLGVAQDLAAQGGGEAGQAGKAAKGGSGPVVDRSGNVEPVTRLDVRVGRVRTLNP